MSGLRLAPAVQKMFHSDGLTHGTKNEYRNSNYSNVYALLGSDDGGVYRGCWA